MLLTMAVRTEYGALLDLLSEPVLPVAVRDHLSDRHLLVVPVDVMKVQTRGIVLLTARAAAPFALETVDPHPVYVASPQGTFGVPLHVPVVPPLVGRQLGPFYTFRDFHVVRLRIETRTARTRCHQARSLLGVVPPAEMPNDSRGGGRHIEPFVLGLGRRFAEQVGRFPERVETLAFGRHSGRRRPIVLERPLVGVPDPPRWADEPVAVSSTPVYNSTPTLPRTMHCRVCTSDAS